MIEYRVKWRGSGGGWTGRVFQSAASAHQKVAWLGLDEIACTVETREVPAWGEPWDGREWAS